MGLRTKFNLVFIIVFLVGFPAVGVVSYSVLQANAKRVVLEKAGVIMELAMGVRNYTASQVRPHLDKQTSREIFLPQSVPAYAATEVLRSIQSKYPDYFYKEAALNPTNPSDKTSDWEADIVNEFRQTREKKEITGERSTPSGRSLFLARPITINEESCLGCHSVPSAAPTTMVRQYGENNGFGWKLHETVGAQIVSVPLTLPVQDANRTFFAFMAQLFGVFVIVFVVVNATLNSIVVRPVRKMSKTAEIVSTGDFALPEFPSSSNDEIGLLAKSFNRMRRSLEQAIAMLEEEDKKK